MASDDLLQGRGLQYFFVGEFPHPISTNQRLVLLIQSGDLRRSSAARPIAGFPERHGDSLPVEPGLGVDSVSRIYMSRLDMKWSGARSSKTLAHIPFTSRMIEIARHGAGHFEPRRLTSQEWPKWQIARPCCACRQKLASIYYLLQYGRMVLH